MTAGTAGGAGPRAAAAGVDAAARGDVVERR